LAVDAAYVSGHFNPDDPRLVGSGELLGDGLWQAVDLMLTRCPVAHSDARWTGVPDGGWVINRYSDVMDVLRDSEVFSSLKKKGPIDEPYMPPFEADPPIHGEYRRLLQPYLSRQSVAKFEPLAREIVTRLIDGFIEAGRCDNIVSQLARPFSSQVQWGWLVGIDAVDQKQMQEWIETWIYRHFEPEFEEANRGWINWIDTTIAKRRTAPRRDDLIDALVYGQIENRPLTPEEIRGVMMIMILGGFSSTGDAVANILFRLAVYPDLQERLRADRSVLTNALEELLRIEPPVTGLARRCTRDTVVGGQEIRAGEHLFYHVAAANRDPNEFESPLQVDFDRKRNRHLSFGAGRHRCLGSNFARQNLKVVFEEILSRMQNIRLIDGDPPERIANVAWGMSRLPLAFDPGPRVLS
jgi:cytochrome P450